MDFDTPNLGDMSLLLISRLQSRSLSCLLLVIVFTRDSSHNDCCGNRRWQYLYQQLDIRACMQNLWLCSIRTMMMNYSLFIHTRRK